MTKLLWLAICLLPAFAAGQSGFYGGQWNSKPPKDVAVPPTPAPAPEGAYQQQRQHPKDLETSNRRSNGGNYGATTTVSFDLPAASYGGSGGVKADLPADTYGGGRPVEPVVDFNCVDLADGNYPDPKDRCNNFYFVCSGYRASKIDCPSKELYFDPDNNVCEAKHHVPACGGQKPTTMLIALDDTMDTYKLFDCSELENGYYVNPADKCSPIYYSCSEGRSKQLQCQTGLDLVFDPDTLACELKDTTYVCTGTRSTQAPATYGSMVTKPNYPMDCKGKEDGLYADPTSKCSHTFYVCSTESISLSTCAGNTFFDVKSQKCDIWMNIFDCSGMEPVKDEPLSTYQHKVVDFDCSSLKPGSYPDPKSKCSNHYYVCTNGIAYEMSCPVTLYWDPDELLCTRYDDIFACTGTTKALTTPTTTTPFVPSDARIPEFDCSNKEDGFWVDPTNKCSTSYFVCSNTHDYKLQCPEGLYFDLETTLCKIWSHVFDCSGKRTEVTYPKMQPTVETEILPIDCKTLPDGDYADTENKCSHIYYSCSGGRGSRRLCAGTATYFDPELRLCEIFDNVPVCSGKERPITTTAPLRDIETFPFDCTRMYNGLYPAGDCETFHWSCIGGVTHKTQCSFELKYDVETMKCDLKSNIPKCGGRRPPAALASYDAVEPSYPIDCHQLADGTYSDPASVCDRTFYVCTSGRTTKMDCPPYLFFDITRHRCDIKKRIVACGGGAVSSDDQSSYRQQLSDIKKDIPMTPTDYQKTLKPAPAYQNFANNKVAAADLVPALSPSGYQQNLPADQETPKMPAAYQKIANKMPDPVVPLSSGGYQQQMVHDIPTPLTPILQQSYQQKDVPNSSYQKPSGRGNWWSWNI